MNNFAPLLFLDPHAVAASLRRHEGLFRAGTPRIFSICRPRKGTEETDEDFVWSEAAAKWAELKNYISRLKREGEKIMGPLELGYITMEMLESNSRVEWQDGAAGPYIERHTRLHVAIRTNPLAMMFVGVEAFSPAPGWLTAINARAPHSAINMGEWPRVHLVADVRKKESEK